jgi:hypothetical protein
VTHTGLTGTTWRHGKELLRVLVGLEKVPTNWRLRWGTRNLVIRANLSSSSNLMALEGLPEDLRKDIIKNILRHCYQITEQGVIMMEIDSINELRMCNLPKHSKSISNLISGLLTFVDDLAT